MGYLSDTCLCLKKETLDKFDALLTKQSPTELKAVGGLLENAESATDHESGDKLWFWHNIKWYSDDVEIRFLESFLETLPQTDYLFIRVGEEMDDNEVRGWYFGNPFEMYLHRTIEFEKSL